MTLAKYIMVALGASVATLGAEQIFQSRLETEVHTYDATGDGIKDTVAYNPKMGEHFAFIGKSDGTFERADVKMDSGVPFFYTEKGYYDPWGCYYPKEGQLFNASCSIQ